jgi:hypothetical protein
MVAVTFFGAGAAPVPGDKLRFIVSETVTLTAALLDAADLVIAGGTLGAVSAPPTMISNHEVEITLGTGVSLVAGATTFTFGAANDAVADGDGQLAVAGTIRTLTKADLDVPLITALTLSAVHPTLNGTGAASGTLQVATTGFDVDLGYADLTSGVDPTLNIIKADVAVLVGGASLVAGENLVPHLTAGTASSTVGSYTVPAGVVFPAGPVTISCYVIDTTGRVSAVSTFAFLAKTMTQALQPFEKNVNASQVWFLDTSRDIESMVVNPVNPTTPVQLTAGANSRSDLEDLFQVLGLWTAAPAANVIGTKNSNEVVMDLFRARVLNEMAGFFAGANISFTFTAPGAFPNAQFVDYNSFSFSQICIAASATTVGNIGIAGRAIFDPHNEVHVDDCLTNFNGERLGVFLHTIVNDAFLAGASTQFALTFNPLMPTRIGGGTSNPVGSSLEPLDPSRLTGATNDQRASDIARAINDLARLTAVITAHECGHSMGLVQDGAMPNGLYGNHAAFTGSSPGHIAMPASVFPGNSLNIMSPALGYVESLDLGTKFNSLNLAYLRESVIYN